MFSIVARDDVLPVTGPAGTMLFVDTSSCFHMGSRRGTKPRYAIMIQYISPFSCVFEQTGPLGRTPFGPAAHPPKPTELERYLVGQLR